MYIAINPQKCRRFTTKGINLSILKPVSAVPVDLDDECMERIKLAIQNEEIFEIDDIGNLGLSIPGLGETTSVEEKDVVTSSFHSKLIPDPSGEEIEVVGLDGKKVTVKKMIRVFQFPEEPVAKESSNIILSN